MARYIVFRVGSNAANQSMVERMVVGYYETPKRIAPGSAYMAAVQQWEEAHPRVTVYNNQHIEIGSWSAWGKQAQWAAVEAEDTYAAESSEANADYADAARAAAENRGHRYNEFI